MNARESRKFQNAVKRGATFLDERRPSWFTKVSTANLDLSDCDVCVLGQLYGGKPDEDGWSEDGYSRGLELLNGVVAKNPAKYGFTLEDVDDENDEYWEKLTALWNAEIAARRKARRTAA